MHDCRQTKALLTDLVFDELTTDVRQRVLAEIALCTACRAEYGALTSLVRVCDQAKDAAQPLAAFWPDYHARLNARLQSLTLDAPDTAPEPAPRPSIFSALAASLRRALTATWRVPVPVAAVAALALVVLATFVLLRPAPVRIVLAAPSQIESGAPVQTVAVPIVQEKIVTRTVYVTRQTQTRHASHPAQIDAARSLAQRSNNESAAARIALAGFRPTGEVKLRVIKGSFTHEQ
jgi:hypothetical protein